MSGLATTLQAYFTTRLVSELGASQHTSAAYRDTWRLLLGFTTQTRNIPPQQLDFPQLTAEVISDFPQPPGDRRGNSVTTRNARLAAIHSFYAFAALRHPEHADTIRQVLNIRPSVIAAPT